MVDAWSQVGKPEIAWNSGSPGTPVGADERARVEKEREIACYLLQVCSDHVLHLQKTALSAAQLG